MKLNFDSSKESLHLAMIGTRPRPNTNSSMPQFNAHFNHNRGGWEGRSNSYRGGHGGRNFNGGGGSLGSGSSNSTQFNSSQFSHRPTCQICYKMGHTTLDYYHRMVFSFQGKHPPTKLAAMAFSSNASTSNCWVFDITATNHFTPDLANIQQAKEYTGIDGVTVGNGQTLPITHIGNAQLNASKHIFHLKHTLRVSNMKSNLLSFFKCCKDNNCRFHFDATQFSIQDIPSGRVLYNGLNEGSLYPIYGDPFKHKSISSPIILKSQHSF